MRRLAVLLAVLAGMVSLEAPAHATSDATTPPVSMPEDTDAENLGPAGEPDITGPQIELDRREVRAGDAVIVTLTGFTSQQATVAVCGNLAKRGSTDCNMPQSQSERIRRDEPETLTQLFIQNPPTDCPCIVRALGSNGEFAIAALDLVDHPRGPTVDPELGPLVEVDLNVERVATGVSGTIKSSLGAAITYAVEVDVRNVTTETLGDVVVRGSVTGRWNDDAAPVEFDVPGPLGPGQTWAQTIEVELPSPTLGTYVWQVAASGAGPTVDAEAKTTETPILLFVLVGLLLLDILLLVVRAFIRMRKRRRVRRERTARIAREQAAMLEEIDDDDHQPVGVG